MTKHVDFDPQLTMKTVSYTHLDVYKRQVVVVVLGQEDEVIRRNRRGRSIKFYLEGSRRRYEGGVAVSYTHLG